jgi:hypothetical protein
MLRLAALLSVGTLGVHQLRYLIGYGGGASHALAVHGHGYLVALAPVLAGVVALALAELLSRAARGGASAPGIRPLWAAATLALFGVYCVQETIEGSPVLSHCGWVALPLAALVGLVIAVVMRSASAPAQATERPWRAPAAPEWPPLPAFPLLVQIRGGAPHSVAARGPPAISA